MLSGEVLRVAIFLIGSSLWWQLYWVVVIVSGSCPKWQLS